MKKLLLSGFLFCIVFLACKSKQETASAPPAEADASTAAVTKQERNKQVVMKSIDDYLKGDIDAMMSTSTVDGVDYGDGSMHEIKGLDSMKSSIKSWLANFESYKGENLHAYASGDSVLVLGDWSGKFKTDFMGMKTAGKTFKVTDVDIFEMTDDGKIKSHRAVQSFNTIMSQMTDKK